MQNVEASFDVISNAPSTMLRMVPLPRFHGGGKTTQDDYLDHTTATGAKASISVTTSMTTGRSAASACAKAAGKADACSTRMPSAPISFAIVAKSTLLKVHNSR